MAINCKKYSDTDCIFCPKNILTDKKLSGDAFPDDIDTSNLKISQMVCFSGRHGSNENAKIA